LKKKNPLSDTHNKMNQLPINKEIISENGSQMTWFFPFFLHRWNGSSSMYNLQNLILHVIVAHEMIMKQMELYCT